MPSCINLSKRDIILAGRNRHPENWRKGIHPAYQMAQSSCMRMQELKFNKREDAGILHDRDKTNCCSHTPTSNPYHETGDARIFPFVEAKFPSQDCTSHNAIGLSFMSLFLIRGKAQTRSPSAGDSEVVLSHHMRFGLASTWKENALKEIFPLHYM